MKSRISRRAASFATVAAPASIAVGAFAYSRYMHDLAAAKARISSGSKLLKTPAGLMEYADVGMGMPVLVIHGAGGGFDQGLELARPLISSGFRVIAPSRFGYLRTPLPEDASPMAQADAYAFLLDTLHLKEVAVVAVSAGGPSAMQLCLRHPDRSAAMVLIVPLAYSETQVGAPKETSSALRAFLMNAFLSSDFIFWIMSKLARKKMFSTILGTPPADVEKAGAEEYTHLTEFLAHIEPISRRKKGLQNEESVAKSLTRYELEQITVPTLIVGIENCLYKTFPGARYTAQHIPGARFVTYPTGGHMAVGHQTEVWSEVKEFVSQHRIVVNGDSVKTGAPASPQEPR